MRNRSGLSHLHRVNQGGANYANLSNITPSQLLTPRNQPRAQSVTANSPVSNWTTAAIDFLCANLPRRSVGTGEDEYGWDHMSSTAYQFGCMALAALGQATKTPWGAIPREPATLPDLLPRWDDIYCAVLALASHQSAISYRCADGTVPPSTRHSTAHWVVTGTPPPPAPNITAAHGLGPAHATPDVIVVLQSLGLIANGRWTAAAELVFWRKQPRAWEMKIMADPRFAFAVANALETLPKAMQAKIAQLTKISQADIAAHIAQHELARADTLARFGQKVWRTPLPDAACAIKSLEFMRRNELDWLIFRHWRLADGWLAPDEAKRALEIFHDPLAIQMRKLVLSQLCPDQPSFAQ